MDSKNIRQDHWESAGGCLFEQFMLLAHMEQQGMARRMVRKDLIERAKKPKKQKTYLVLGFARPRPGVLAQDQDQGLAKSRLVLAFGQHNSQVPFRMSTKTIRFRRASRTRDRFQTRILTCGTDPHSLSSAHESPTSASNPAASRPISRLRKPRAHKQLSNPPQLPHGHSGMLNAALGSQETSRAKSRAGGSERLRKHILHIETGTTHGVRWKPWGRFKVRFNQIVLADVIVSMVGEGLARTDRLLQELWGRQGGDS